jgi:hypothetical protein
MVKTIKYYFVVYLFSIFFIATYGQNDTVLKTNGEEMLGKVTAIKKIENRYTTK